jgi:diguanylate cyclase (GGDEF)-like protein/PAS domain S-box-containing protein
MSDDERQSIYLQILDASPCAMMRVDPEGRIQLANRACTQILGYSPDELQGRSVDELVPEEHRTAHARNRRYYMADPIRRPMGDGQRIRAERRDGTEVPVEVTLNPVQWGDEPAVLVSLLDLTDRIRLEETVHLREQQLQLARERICSASASDPVTGARNRSAFFDDLASRATLALRRGHDLSLVLLDIDRFKGFNIEHGQQRGDELLKRVAAIARYTARGSDLLSRTGADVFTLLLPETDAEGADRFAERLQRAVRTAEWTHRPITTSLGVSTLETTAAGESRPSTDELRRALYEQAQLALAEAKARGGDAYVHARELSEDPAKG